MAAHTKLRERVKTLFDGYQVSELLKVLEEVDNQVSVEDEAMDLIDLTCSMIVENVNVIEPNILFASLKKLFNIIADRGNPKEVIIALLNGTETLKECSVHYEVMFSFYETLKKTLQKLPKSRGKSLDWVEVLDVLYNHVLSTPNGIEDKTTFNALSAYLNFLETFVDEVSLCKLEEEIVIDSIQIFHQQEILKQYLLKLFHCPLLNKEFHKVGESCSSTCHPEVAHIIRLLNKLCRNIFCLFYKALSWDFQCSQIDDHQMLSLGNLAYVIFALDGAASQRPYIFQHKFLFKLFSPFGLKLLMSEEEPVIYKGLALIRSLLEPIEDLELTQSYCVLNEAEFSKYLLNVSIFCPRKSYRTLSRNVHDSYVKKLDWELRFKYLMVLANPTNRTEVQAVAISYYKTFMHESWGAPSFNYFSGKHLHGFLKFCLSFKGRNNTDILSDGPRLLPAVNFLYYIVLRDPWKQNVSGFWDIIEFVFSEFAEPLFQAIEITRVHCLHKKKNEPKRGKRVISTVTVNGGDLSDIPENFDGVDHAINHLDLLKHRLCCFMDMVDCR